VFKSLQLLLPHVQLPSTGHLNKTLETITSTNIAEHYSRRPPLCKQSYLKFSPAA
uniref:Ovule protein n=1 Tax=Ascaris lumbricoides TaxID=6252 RepID=A0A0M3IA71_ASCLU